VPIATGALSAASAIVAASKVNLATNIATIGPGIGLSTLPISVLSRFLGKHTFERTETPVYAVWPMT
jgi:hypothetical protein